MWGLRAFRALYPIPPASCTPRFDRSGTGTESFLEGGATERCGSIAEICNASAARSPEDRVWKELAARNTGKEKGGFLQEIIGTSVK